MAQADEDGPELSLKELGRLLLDRFVARQAELKGLPTDPVPEGFAESVRQALRTVDLPIGEHAVLEKALRWAARGESEVAGRMLLEAVYHSGHVAAALDEAVTGRRRQQARARKPRVDPLQELIVAIVKRTPTASTTDVLNELEKQIGEGVIEEIVEDEIVFIGQDGKGGQTASLSGLKDRVSRARRALSLKKSRRE